MLDDPLALVPSDVLRERLPALVAEACAWAVGLSDRPHVVHRQGRDVASGTTLGDRAATGRPLGDDSGRLELGDARPGTFSDALNARTGDGGGYADRFEADVLEPFVREACASVAHRARTAHPRAWQELLDELGDDGDDVLEVARAAEWDSRLRVEAEQLLAAALGDVPLVAVEAEGLSLSVVRAAEAEARRSSPESPPPPPRDDDLAGAVFLVEDGIRSAGLPVPVPADRAPDVLQVLQRCGIEADEVVRLVRLLPLDEATTREIVRRTVDRA